MKNKKIKYRILQIVLIAITIILGTIYFILVKNRSDIFNQQKVCSNIVVNVKNENNQKLITDTKIISILNNKKINPIRKSVSAIKTKLIEDVLQKHPVVKAVECYKSPNGNLLINVEQRNILFRVIGLENYYVDNECNIVPVSEEYTAFVPVITGSVSRKMIQNEVFHFIKFLRKNKFWDNQIVQIDVNAKKEIELVPRVGNHIIKLGKLNRYKSKLNKLEKFYKKGLMQVGWKKYSIIDVRFKNQVVCR